MTSGDDDPLFKSAWIAATEPVPRHPLAPRGERYAAMDVPELAAQWRRIQHFGLRERIPDVFEAEQYFDHLPHEEPRRALALVLEVLRAETDRSVRMQLNDRLMTALVHRHGDALVDEIEAAAGESADFRWLLGGVCFWAEGRTRARLEAIADAAAWDADHDEARRPAVPIDFRNLTIDELARVWIEQKSKPAKDCDDNWYALMDHEHDLAAGDPEKLVDLALAVLKIESDPNVLGLFAAGPLENAVGHATIDRMEREAADNPAFVAMLGGMYYFSEPDDIKARLDAIFERAGRGA
ncbi:DUF6869 domain-containing protein [Chenggangzhangella methanolivorans]|uniref:DUF6869 domain-containing protein n=1 Tax=Chenggangzhangella methanolivorans TaxID=1437009 RepID=A0A9E6RCD5_9HYPH|nr:hypothetical protein [Chenggangzhangella methanolivorans]QZO00714.1 hypothetical protein K6K41_03160 [Chenggangzhangella methanolivorans]